MQGFSHLGYGDDYYRLLQLASKKLHIDLESSKFLTEDHLPNH